MGLMMSDLSAWSQAQRCLLGGGSDCLVATSDDLNQVQCTLDAGIYGS